jgi:uncharacterized membrane protein
MKIVKRIVSISGVLFVVTGAYFRIIHWPYSIILMVSGLILYFVSVVLSFFKNENNFNPDN